MKKDYLIFILLVLAFLLGISTLSNRGESWDEFLLHKYAVRSLDAYQTWPIQGEVNITLDDLGGYGPFFLMLDELGHRLLSMVLPSDSTDIYHLINFVTYLAGVWAFYDLGTRWLSRTSALGATLFFLAQPLFWGHAFMNSKDIPFLSFFLLSLAFGFRMIDHLNPILFSASTDRTNRTLAFLSVFWLVSVFGLFVATDMVHTILENLIRSAAAGNTNIISMVASHIRTAPPELYLQKFFLLFLRIRLFYVLLFTFLLLYLYYRHSPETLQSILPIVIPGILLGVTTSVRILGPFAGLLVVAYGLRTKGLKAIPSLGIYAVIAIMAMYLTWPYLWENPVEHFLESAQLMSAYPWGREVLFNGQRYVSSQLPYSYLPVLFAVQLTEPVWILFLIGLVITIIEGVKRQEAENSGKRVLLELVLLWFIIPVIGFIFRPPTLYDNFRQLLFILPPVFLMAGVAFTGIRNPIWQLVLIALVVVPGLLASIRLHPFEYIYYNSFVGGVSGAQNRFELDYWATSYRQAANYVNRIAPANTYVWVEGPAHVFAASAREDLKVLDAFDPLLNGQNYYAVAHTRDNLDQIIAPNAKVIYTVTCDRVPLSVIKQP